MTKRITFGELPSHFQKLQDGSLEEGLNQVNGDVFVPVEQNSEEVRQAMYAINHTCGVCAAAHIADLAETPIVQILSVDALVWGGSEEFGELEEPADILCDRNDLHTRSFHDGILVLFKTLLGSSKFVDWLNEEVRADEDYRRHGPIRVNDPKWRMLFKPDGVENVLQVYMEEECGAVEGCFGSAPWPDDQGYRKVFTKLVENNAAIKDMPLARLAEGESHTGW